jgi:hypothetical protein
VDVAPALVRVTGKLNGLAPELVASLNRRLGSRELSQQVADGQRSKR